LVTWKIVFARQAQKDARKLSAAGLKPKAEQLLEVLQADPLQSPVLFEKRVGNLAGACLWRINVQRRLIYQILKKETVVKVIRMWTHCE